MPKSRNEFIEYCLRKNGAPVINVNVAREQVEDRVDEAIQLWQEHHYDATERLWVGYQVTQEDETNGYLTLPEDIHVVSSLIPMSSLYNDLANNGVFSFEYQFMLTNLNPWQPLDMINYYLMKTNINEVNDLVNTRERFEYTKHKNKLVIYKGRLKEGEKLAFEVFKYLDQDEDTGLWNDKWLKEYASALIRQQWGINMFKHSGIQLLGGVTIDGKELYESATQDIQRLQEQLRDTYEEPIGFFTG